MRCVGYCTAGSYKILAIADYFKSQQVFVRFHKNILHLQFKHKKCDVFIFQHGSFVAWNLSSREEQEMLQILKRNCNDPYEIIEIDYFTFKYSDKTKLSPHESYNIDVIQLEDDDYEIKLAISYGIAQSVKLQAYEDSIQRSIEKNYYLPKTIAATGKVPLARGEIAKRMGQILLEKSAVNLSSEYLDVPDFFWEYPRLENYYMTTMKFLDIRIRVEALNQRLDVLQDLFDILNSQLEYSYSNMLEITIIVLIAIEIIVNSLQIYFWH